MAVHSKLHSDSSSCTKAKRLPFMLRQTGQTRCITGKPEQGSLQEKVLVDDCANAKTNNKYVKTITPSSL